MRARFLCSRLTCASLPCNQPLFIEERSKAIPWDRRSSLRIPWGDPKCCQKEKHRMNRLLLRKWTLLGGVGISILILIGALVLTGVVHGASPRAQASGRGRGVLSQCESLRLPLSWSGSGWHLLHGE